MPDYIDIPIVTDPDALSTAVFNYLQVEYPGWAPNDGNLETVLIEALARMVAEARDVASAVPTSIFRYFGGSILNILPLEDAPASGTTTWTANDNAGYTIPAGTLIGVRAAGDTLISFETVNTVVIPPGSLSTAVGEVSIVALVDGEDGNLLTGNPELIDSLDWVSVIQLVGTTSGGVDAEEDSDYLNRLTTQMQLLSPRPILPNDFVVLARTVPGVARAAAVDGYNPFGPLGGTFNNERTIAVAVADEAGEPLSSAIKQQVDDLLQSKREVNFVVNVIDATYNLINVTVSYKVDPLYTAVEVDAAVLDAINSYLSPASWGSLGAASSVDWEVNLTLRYLELASVINSVVGVDYIISLTLAKYPDALAAADVTLLGVVPLTRPNTIVVTGS